MNIDVRWPGSEMNAVMRKSGRLMAEGYDAEMRNDAG